jgi:hypothetical protein
VRTPISLGRPPDLAILDVVLSEMHGCRSCHSSNAKVAELPDFAFFRPAHSALRKSRKFMLRLRSSTSIA